MATRAQKELRAQVEKLESLQQNQILGLKLFAETAKRELKPGTVAKKLLVNIYDKKFKKDILTAISPIITAFVSGKIAKKSKSLRTSLIATLSQFGINGMVSSYGRTIRNYSMAIIEVAKESIQNKK